LEWWGADVRQGLRSLSPTWWVLSLLVVTAVGCILRPRLVLLVCTGALAVVWVRVNGPVEGAVLYSFDDDHGLTVADLAVLVVVPATWAYLVSRRGAVRWR
jgi:hypothetical protein